MEPLVLKVASMPELRRGPQVSPRYIHERLCLNMSTLGNLKRLKRLYKESKDSDDKINWGAIAVTAAKSGHISVLKWIKTVNSEETRSTLTRNFWYQEIPMAAAEYNRIAILDWLFEILGGQQLHPDVCAGAVKGGHIELLKWLIHKGVPWGVDCCVNAVEFRKFEILRWLRSPDQEQKCPWNSQVCAVAAKNGDLGILQELRSYESEMGRCRWDSWTCARAAEFGHLHVIKWARGCKRRCRWNEWTCTLAARNGHLECLVWCRNQSKPCPWNEGTCAAAAAGDHLNVLKYLRTGKLPGQEPPENFEPCPWDDRVPRSAVGGDSLRVLIWSLRRGCDWDYRKCKGLAKSRENLDILEWLKAEGRQYRDPVTIKSSRISENF